MKTTFFLFVYVYVYVMNSLKISHKYLKNLHFFGFYFVSVWFVVIAVHWLFSVFSFVLFFYFTTFTFANEIQYHHIEISANEGMFTFSKHMDSNLLTSYTHNIRKMKNQKTSKKWKKNKTKVRE